MAPKKSNKNPDSQQSEKLIKPRPPLVRLAKDDISCILYAKALKGESKKVSEWYKIGNPKCNKIWKSEDPYSYANSIGEPNLPEWYPTNTKIEKTESAPEPVFQEIDIPEESVIVKPDPIEVKRKRKTAEIENIARCIYVSMAKSRNNMRKTMGRRTRYLLSTLLSENDSYGTLKTPQFQDLRCDRRAKGVSFMKSEISDKTKFDEITSGGLIILNCFIPGEEVKNIFEIKISNSNDNQVSSLGPVIGNARLDKFQDTDPSKFVLHKVEFVADSVIINNLKNDNKTKLGVKMKLQDTIFSHFPTQPQPIYSGEKGINVIVYPTEA
ncbi:hypothetical protein Glove_103g255 [Diversispora epigaea]|uniref:Uncharacterized protein n=1 Tax=Diversispora epigaea TaxID=1348612 RepID=A0A397JE21_9GLOM|nr:hypothetical protein Glove_103g255 [Diversispora epigaea]